MYTRLFNIPPNPTRLTRNLDIITFSHRQSSIVEPTIVLHGIQFSGICGVTPTERIQPQPIVVDLELDFPNTSATLTDNLGDTIDYTKVVEHVIQIGAEEKFFLVECLADRVCRALLDEFPISSLRIWVRKIAPPISEVTGSVGIRLTRYRECPLGSSPCHHLPSPPSRFLVEQRHHLSKGKILDIATGSGRNALYLASLEFSVVGIDRDAQALASLEDMARKRELSHLSVHQLDLEANPTVPPELGKEEFDGIIVFFYLFRPIFPKILRALKPGGVLIYETFLIDNHQLHDHPRRKEFCLNHNELLFLSKGLRVLHYQEGEHEESKEEKRVVTARLVAKKDGASLDGSD